MTTYRHRVSGPGPAGDIWLTTLHSESAQQIGTAHAAWAAAVTSFLTNSLGPMWSTETQATQVQTDQLDPVTGKNVAQVISAVTLKGTGSGNAISQRVAVITSLRTYLPTRAGRGRMYWPAPDDSHFTTTGELLTADAATLATDWAAALTAMQTSTTPVIYHRNNKTTTPIAAVSVSTVLGTQRRRTNKVPANYQSHGV